MRAGPRQPTGAACARFLEPLLHGAKQAIVPDHAYATRAGLRSGVYAWGWQHRMQLQCRKAGGVYEVTVRESA